MQAETKFKIQIRPLIDGIPQCTTFKIQQVGLRGVPDFLCCIKGWFVALELKRSKRAKVQDLQLYYLSKITKSGGFGILVYPENWEQVYKFLLTLEEKNNDPDCTTVTNIIRSAFQTLEGSVLHYGGAETSTRGTY